MIRAKLIGPTNVLLEHPLLSPVADNQFFLVGKTEYEKNRKEWMNFGFILGGVASCIFFTIMNLLLRGWK